MYKDLISYELAEGIDETHLLKVAELIFNDWMKHQKGFISWEINQNTKGHYTDIVIWESKEDAALSNKNMANMPHASEWMGCYKMETVNSESLTSIFNFK